MTWPRTGPWPATPCSRSRSPCRTTSPPSAGACPACGYPRCRPEPRPRGTMPELIAARAVEMPDAVAVGCGETYVSYRELLDQAGRLGGYLRAAGAGPETVVGLCLDRGLDLVTAIVATWLAGAAYLPL